MENHGAEERHTERRTDMNGEVRPPNVLVNEQ